MKSDPTELLPPEAFEDDSHTFGLFNGYGPDDRMAFEKIELVRRTAH